jgi:hypothetical protein
MVKGYLAFVKQWLFVLAKHRTNEIKNIVGNILNIHHNTSHKYIPI